MPCNGARCKKLVPPSWASTLKLERQLYSLVRQVIERNVQRSPGAWQEAVRLEAVGGQQPLIKRALAKAEEEPSCDGCGLPAAQLKCCACRLRRCCSRECQKRAFPAHKAECKKVRGIA